MIQIDSLSETEIESKLEELLEYVQRILLDHESDYEIRLQCVRLSTEKIVNFVPVYEAEDSLYYPLLTGIKDFIEQVFSSTSSKEAEERELLLSIARTLIEHTDSLLQHAAKLTGLGPNEIPSIPRSVPKIVRSTFKFCRTELSLNGSDESLSLLYSRSKCVMTTFLKLIEGMTIKCTSDGEVTLLLDLLEDLTQFHEVLYSIDMKMCVLVWNLYNKLIVAHHENLKYSLKVEQTLIILQKEALEAIHQLDIALIDGFGQLTKQSNRCLRSVSFLFMIIHNISKVYKNSMKIDFALFVDFLSILYNRSRTLMADSNVKDKLDNDLFIKYPPQLFLNDLPDLSLLANFLSLTEPCYLTHVYIIFDLLDVDALTNEEKISMITNLLDNLALVEEYNLKMDYLDCVEADGLPVHKVSLYEWLLTKMCRFISILSAEQFTAVEQTLFHQLFFSDHIFTCQLVADIFCFIGRYGNASLCYSLLETISEVHRRSAKNLPYNLVVPTLIGRLFHFLSADEKISWMEKFSPEETNLTLWACLRIERLDQQSLKAFEKLSSILEQAYVEVNESDYSVTKLSNILDCHNNIIISTTCESSIAICLEIWQKLADYEYSMRSNFSVSQLMRSLSDLASSIAQIISREQLLDLITCQGTVLKATNAMDGDYKLLSGFLLTILKLFPSLPWVSNIENVDPCLITEIGALSSLCLRTAVREPVLKIPGLQYLRNLAQASNNSGLIRLCSDENDIMDHFTLFLKEDDAVWDAKEIQVKIDKDAPCLFSLLTSQHRPDEGNHLQVKRKTSFSNLHLKVKRSREEVTAGDGQSFEHILEMLKVNVSKLEDYQCKHESQLTEQQKCEVESVVQRLLAISHK